MGQYSSYYLYQKYEKRGSQDWIPYYPNTYSVSGDSSITMPLSLKEECDDNCGCGTPEGQYRWIVVDGYVCDDCEVVKATIHTSGETFVVSGSGEITREEVSDYSSAATDVVISNSVTSIGSSAFSYFVSIQFARIPSTVATIGASAFTNCTSLEECQIPYGCTYIGNAAFSGCTSLAYADIPSTVTSIGASAFTNCLNFRYVSIPSSISSIPESCFYNCDGLSDVELPISITSIGALAFQNCSGLYSVTVYATTPPTLGIGAFSSTNPSLKFYVPSDSLNSYKASWRDFANKIYPIE